MTRRPPSPPRVSRRALGLNIAAGVFLLAVGIGVAAYSVDQARQFVDDAPTEAVTVARPESHVLGEAETGDATLVAFLDFESVPSRSAYSLIETLRQRYEGEVTFFARHFPDPSNQNAINAARAAEAAARQGEFERMYQRLFDTQAAWAGQDVSAAVQFRDFAADLGLDLARYDADVADPATLNRVLTDQADGTALDVQRAPTFFLDGRRFDTADAGDLTAAIDDALNE